MSKHTAGPWKLCREEHPRGWIVDANDGQYTICIVRDGTGEAQNIANARLIAAAPELLAVLQELRESADYWSEYDVPCGIVDRIDAAIAKAVSHE